MMTQGCRSTPHSAPAHKKGVCAKHCEHELRLFCSTCHGAICIAGAATEHCDHDIELITSVASRYAAAVSNDVETAGQTQAQLMALIAGLGELEQALCDKVMEEKQRLKTHFGQLSSLLRDREESLLAELEAEEARAKAKLQHERVHLESAAKTVNRAFQNAVHIVTRASSLEIIEQSACAQRDIRHAAASQHVRRAQVNLQAQSFTAIAFEPAPAGAPLEVLLSQHGRVAHGQDPSSLLRLFRALSRLVRACILYLANMHLLPSHRSKRVGRYEFAFARTHGTPHPDAALDADARS